MNNKDTLSLRKFQGFRGSLPGNGNKNQANSSIYNNKEAKKLLYEAAGHLLITMMHTEVSIDALQSSVVSLLASYLEKMNQTGTSWVSIYSVCLIKTNLDLGKERLYSKGLLR